MGFSMQAKDEKSFARGALPHEQCIAIHRKPQTRRIDEDSTHLYGEEMQRRMRLSGDCYKWLMDLADGAAARIICCPHPTLPHRRRAPFRVQPKDLLYKTT